MKLTRKMLDFLIELVYALTLPSESTQEHQWLETSIENFQGLKFNNAEELLAEVRGMLIALENYADVENSSHKKTSLKFAELRYKLKMLQLKKAIYHETFLQNEETETNKDLHV